MSMEDRPYMRQTPQPVGSGIPKPPPMTLAVIVACVLVYMLQQVPDLHVAHWLQLDSRPQYLAQSWRLVTYAYLHGDPLHIFLNLLGLWFCLSPLERIWGWRKAFAFYTLGTIVAAGAFIMLSMLTRPATLVGASGGVLAALGACAALMPHQQVTVLVFTVPIRMLAGLLGLFYALYVIGQQSLSDAAHLAGLAFGFFGALPVSQALGTFLAPRDRKVGPYVPPKDEGALQKEVDRILAKVSAKGLGSITPSERRTLQEASRRL